MVVLSVNPIHSDSRCKRIPPGQSGNPNMNISYPHGQRTLLTVLYMTSHDGYANTIDSQFTDEEIRGNYHGGPLRMEAIESG